MLKVLVLKDSSIITPLLHHTLHTLTVLELQCQHYHGYSLLLEDFFVGLFVFRIYSTGNAWSNYCVLKFLEIIILWLCY